LQNAAISLEDRDDLVGLGVLVDLDSIVISVFTLIAAEFSVAPAGSDRGVAV
jgi:hypothetical protein